MSKFRYKNLALFVLGIIIAYFFVRLGYTHQVSAALGDWGYLGSFILGIMFSSSLTVGIATVFLFNLGQELNPFIVAILAGGGAASGDFIFYFIIKDRLFNELKELYSKVNFFPKRQLEIIFANEYFNWFIPSIAYLIILSPIPDEVGVGILSTLNINIKKLLIVTFILNTVGIFLIVFISRVF